MGPLLNTLANVLQVVGFVAQAGIPVIKYLRRRYAGRPVRRQSGQGATAHAGRAEAGCRIGRLACSPVATDHKIERLDPLSHMADGNQTCNQDRVFYGCTDRER